MFVTHLNLNKGVEGFLKNGLLEIHKLHQRHDELVREMERRGYKHRSALMPLNTMKVAGNIDRQKNLTILAGRCEECRQRQDLEKGHQPVFDDRAVNIATKAEPIVQAFVDPKYRKPQCSLVGLEGNPFAVINKVANTLKRVRGVTTADQFCVKAFETDSKTDLMELVKQYVEVI
jgi:hypothetical protein